MADGVVYIKIAKTDKNGVNQTNTLQSLNQVTIPYSTGNITYKVLNIVEHPTFFLYYVNPAGVEWADRAEIKYDFTGSLTTIALSGSNNYEKIPITNNLNDSLEFFDLTNRAYQIKTYPQKDIHVEFSGSVFVNRLGPAGMGTKNATVGIALGNPDFPDSTILNITNITVTGANTTFSFHISASIPEASFEGRLGEYIFPYYDRNTTSK